MSVALTDGYFPYTLKDDFRKDKTNEARTDVCVRGNHLCVRASVIYRRVRK